MQIARALVALAFPLGCRLARIPRVGWWPMKMLPAALYYTPDMTLDRCRIVSLLDTFDQLSPAFDAPQRASDVLRWLEEVGVVDLQRQRARGVTITGRLGSGPGRTAS
jgi:hypothetical protein